MKPVLLVTNHVPPDRVGAFAALHQRVGVELALFGGRTTHATGGVEDPGVPHVHLDQRAVYARAASGRYRAVICGTAGRVALPAAYAGARRSDTPFVLWTALWAPLRSPALLASGPLLAHLYRNADAIVAYGEHVKGYVAARGATRVHIAPQAVDAAFWETDPQSATDFVALFVGRDAEGKGLDVLREAWARAELPEPARLELAGPGGHVSAEAVRNFLRAASVIVVPSVPTPRFREPWGLVANEAMHQGVPVIATTAVGAAAGGLVRHERNGLVVPSGDPQALGDALRRLHGDHALTARLGENARRDVAAFSFDAFAGGFAAAVEDAASPRRKDYR